MFNKELIEAIKDKMLERKESVAVAESVTAGMLQTAFSLAKDALRFFQGGITAYNIGQKYRHLLVDPIHADACNCVSEQIAESMAMNVRPMFKSDWGIGVCGYAAPVAESNSQMYAFYALAYDEHIVTSGRLDSNKNEGPETQAFFTEQILHELHSYLLQNPD